MADDGLAWHRLAERLGGEVHPFWGGGMPLIQVGVGQTIVTADAPAGDALGFATRVRAVYLSRRHLHFGVRTEGVLSGLGKALFGVQDIVVGDEGFDRRFLVQGSDPERTRALLGAPEVRSLVEQHRRFHLVARPLRRWAQGYLNGDPTDLDELWFRGRGVLSPQRLERVFALFAELLAALERLERGDRDEVAWQAWRLGSRGGKVMEMHVLLWSGDEARREAAARLGELGDPRGVKALAEALEATDTELVAGAVDALGALGDPRAVGPLAALLGSRRGGGGRLLGERAARTLRRLGASELVDAFQRALQGDDGALRRCLGDHAQYVARALVGVLGGSDLSAVEAAARTLGWVGTMTEVPELRRIRASTGWDRTREACKAAIAELTSKASLPRPAEPAREDADTLPRVAGPHRPDAGRLPRPAGADTTEFAPGEPTDD